MKNTIAFIAVFVVLASSGCTVLEGIIGTTIDGISIRETTEKEVADILTISNVDTLPRSPIFADQPFTLYLTIKNIDKEKTAERVSVRLFDPSVFIGSTYPDECAYSCSIPPGGEKTISFELTAPSSRDIAYSRTTKRISFVVSYYFESRTVYGIVVLDRDEIIKQQQAGKTISVVSEKRIGSGPVKIYPELDGEKFIMSSTERSLKFILKNEGSGTIQNNRIERNYMTIDFPSGFSPTGSFLSRSIFDEVAATGNAIITGMASSCDSRCGNYIQGDISGGCSAGCSCDLSSECASGLSCIPYGGTGEFWCQVPATTTSTTLQSCYDKCVSTYGYSSYVSSQCTYSPDTSYSCVNSYTPSKGEILSGSSCEYPESCVCRHKWACNSGYTCQNGQCVWSGTSTTKTTTTVKTTTSTTTRTTIANPRSCSEYCMNALGFGTASYDVSGAITGRDQYSDPCGALFPFCTAGTCNYGCQALSLTEDQLRRIGLASDDICYCLKTSSCDCGSGGSKYCTNSGCSSTPGGGGGYTTTTYYSSKTFSCSGSSCSNIVFIDIFGKESSPLIFRIRGPETGEPYEVYDVTATAGYVYELRGDKDITIIPVETT